MRQAEPEGIDDGKGGRAALGPFDRRKEEILNSAGALINRHGLRAVTLAMIAADIGLNQKSLRYYFRTRDDLVAAAFMRSIELHRRLAQDALAEPTIDARIRCFVRGYFELSASIQSRERPELVHFGDLKSLTPPHSDTVWPEYYTMFNAVRQLFCSPEIVWAPGQLNAHAHMLLAQLLWSVLWACDYLPGDAAGLSDRFCDILLNGLCREPFDVSAPDAALALAPPEPDRLSQHSFLRAATALINQLGCRGASVERISAELNVTKGAFYHYNDTRDGLLVACFEQSFGHLRRAQEAASATCKDGATRVAAASISLVELQMRESGALLRTSALTAVGPELRVRMARELSRFTLRFADMLNDGMVDGSVRMCNVRIGAEMIITMINSAEELGRWVRTATPENAADLYVRPLLNGLLPRGR